MLFDLTFLKEKPVGDDVLTFIKNDKFVDVDGDLEVTNLYLTNEEFIKFDDLQIFNNSIREMIGFYGFVFVEEKETNKIYYMVADRGIYKLDAEAMFRTPLSKKGKIVGSFSIK